MMTTTARRRRGRPAAVAVAAASCCCSLLLTSPVALAAAEEQSTSGGGGGGPTAPIPFPMPGGGKEAYSFDTKVRTLSILQSLRSGQHALEVLDEALPGGEGEVGFAMEMRGWDGRPYTCAPVMDPRPSANATMSGEQAIQAF